MFGDIAVKKPFDVAFGSDGNAYVTGTESDNLAVLRPDGTPAPGSPFGGFASDGDHVEQPRRTVDRNSGLVHLPCPRNTVTF